MRWHVWRRLDDRRDVGHQRIEATRRHLLVRERFELAVAVLGEAELAAPHERLGLGSGMQHEHLTFLLNLDQPQ